MEEFWTEVYGNCIGTVCERLKLLSKGYSFWMVFIVLFFYIENFWNQMFEPDRKIFERYSPILFYNTFLQL